MLNEQCQSTDVINLTQHTHARLTVLCPGLPGWASTRKVKPIWILLKQETVSGSGINCKRCKSASRSRQITTPAPHHSVFTGRMPFLPPNQQHQSTEGIINLNLTQLHEIFIDHSTMAYQYKPIIINLIQLFLTVSMTSFRFNNGFVRHQV